MDFILDAGLFRQERLAMRGQISGGNQYTLHRAAAMLTTSHIGFYEGYIISILCSHLQTFCLLTSGSSMGRKLLSNKIV